MAVSVASAAAAARDDDGLGVSTLNGTSGSASSMRGRPYISVTALSYAAAVVVVMMRF